MPARRLMIALINRPLCSHCFITTPVMFGNSMNSRRETGLARSNLPAVGLMLTSGVCYSVIPLLLVRLGGGDDPFLFNSVYRFRGVIGALSFLVLFYRDLLLDRRVMEVVLIAVLDWRVVWVIIPYFSFTAFAWSLRYVDVTLTTIVQEIWPVFFIILTDRLLRAEGRFDPPTVSQIVLALLGFIGFIFVVLSQEVRAGGREGSALWGVGLALVAALMASATSYNYRWAYNLREALAATSTSEIGGNWSGDRVLFFFLMTAFVVGSATSAVVNFILVPANFVDGFSSDNGMGSTIFFGGVLVGGAILDAGGTVFNRQATPHCLNKTVTQRKWLPQIKCYPKSGRQSRGRRHQQDGKTGIAGDDPRPLPSFIEA